MYNLFWFLRFFLRLPKLSRQKSARYQPLISFIRRLRGVIFLLCLVTGIGVLGYRWVEGYTWLESYYMTIITLASVGFSEVRPLSDAGRLFTTFLIIFNIGFFTYAITTLTSLFAEGSFFSLIKDLIMIDEINQLRGHTIICGFGRHGRQVAEELSKQQVQFVIIEESAEKVTWIQEHTSYLVMQGDATSDEILLESSIKDAEAIVMALPSDSDNLFIIYSSRQLNPELRIVSRAINERAESKLRKAGADYVVMPEKIGGFYMATLAKNPDLVEFFTLLSNMGGSNVQFEEILVADLKLEFQNKSILESGIMDITHLNIIAVRFPEGRYVLHPPEQTILTPQMHLVMLGDHEQVEHFKKITRPN